ncbi:DUF2460 domain-containing protein [Oceanibium sediminis]|uniref:DUF2460 domain-containing protein n=1 Tax=Oceanibium sediminis TaxID=2026339 RepID=UPI000DD4C819|nr:DUF2460 domain-containing protein [Oceanibium sediminis]
MSFHEVRFPVSLSFGSVGGPERRTEIVTLNNGAEERTTPWAHSRRRYDAGFGMRSLDDLEELIGFFEARGGQLYGFRWRDWTDYKSCPPSQTPDHGDQTIGHGDGERRLFQLSKTYWSGDVSYTRPITKPVAGTETISIDGDDRVEGVDYTLDHMTGVVVFAAAPQPGAPVQAGFEFDVPVRFDTDRIEASVAGFQAGEVPSVPVIEVRV